MTVSLVALLLDESSKSVWQPGKTGTNLTMTTKKAAASARDRGHKPRKAKPEIRTENRKKRTLPEAARPFMFKPGQSGNPGGRPKRDFASEIAQAIFEQNPEMVYKAMLKSLRKGSAGAFAVLAERGYGKSPQPIEVDGKLAAEVKVTFTNVAATAQS